jgi:hypothetical protein
LAVQGKINDSLEQAEKQKSNVKRIVTGLRFQKEKKEKLLDQKKKEREALIAGV